jgi:hypothetical protein
MARQVEVMILVAALASALSVGKRLQNAAAQPPGTPQTLQDPIKQAAPPLELNNETILDGLGKLNQSTTGVGYAVEMPLGQTISAKAPALRRFQVVLAPNTLANVLDQLCQLDPTFSWQRVGSEINVFPRALENDKSYLFNRKLELLEIKDAPDAQAAVFQAVAQLPPPREQIAMMQTGASVNFSRTWNASFKDITIREAFDKIAQQIGSNYGWQFTGAADFRIVIFYARLGTMPTNNPGQPKPAGQ